MAKFITIGYGDQADYDRTDVSVRDAAHARDAQLEASGATVGIAGPPVQVRNHEDLGIHTTDGPFMRSDVPLAGFGVIDAANIDEAVSLVAGTPCAVAYGVVEVWPLE